MTKVKTATAQRTSYLPAVAVLAIGVVALGVVSLAHHHAGAIMAIRAGGAALTICAILAITTSHRFAQNATSGKQSTRRTATISAMVVALMLLFSYEMIPLFHLVCHQFGIRGRVAATVAQTAPTHQGSGVAAASTHVNVTTINHGLLPVALSSSQEAWDVMPGGTLAFDLTAKNESGRVMNIHPVISVSPSAAGAYISRTAGPDLESTGLSLATGEGKTIRLSYQVSEALPESMRNIAMGLTFFEDVK